MHWPIIPHLTVADLLSGFADDADVVISAAEVPDWPQRNKVRVHFYFPDTDHLPDMGMARSLTQWAALEVHSGVDVVVHCDEGKNRSAFLAGLVLAALPYAPYRGQALLDLIRRQRPGALDNATFAAALVTFAP